MKSVILTFCLLLWSFHPAPGFSAQTATVTGIYYKADQKAENGYREAYRWRFNASDEWRRFVNFAPQMTAKTDAEASPFKRAAEDFIILSVKDANGVTGRDYFLSKHGVMISSITAESVFYSDAHDFYSFLKEETLNHKGFETFPGEKFANDKQGVIVRYNINEELPNPSWRINTQENLNLYDSFLRELTPMERLSRADFDRLGHFNLLLNYPKAPGEFATIGPDGIRISKSVSEDKFYKDERGYYEFFRKAALEHMAAAADMKAKDKLLSEQGQF